MGSAEGTDHSASASDTDARGSKPSGDPKLPSHVKNTVGKERAYPDPPTVGGAQCLGCAPGTRPLRAKSDSPAAEDAEQPASAIQQESAAVTGFQQGRSTELVEERTEASTVFENPDGTKTARIFAGATYARDDSGAMVPIDTTLTTSADGRLRPVAAADVSFAGQVTAERLASMTVAAGLEASFGLAGAEPVTGAASGSEVRYPGVLPETDLVLTATKEGFKDELILHSAAAPVRYLFPMQLKGLTPEIPANTGRVDLRDETGEVRASIPPGFMYDSTPDPRTGSGVLSTGVTYRIVPDGTGWQLEVTLDGAWLRDPQRRFPVTVDPPLTMREPAFQDTFVSSSYFAKRDNGAFTYLKVGTPNGGVEKAATYLQFIHVGELEQRYIVGASLSLYQNWAPSCTAANVTVYPVTESWSQFSGKGTTWPGPAYDSADSIGQKSFNRGGNCASKAAGYETITLDRAEMTELLDKNHDFYGFTLRASNTSSSAEKWFYSGENPTGNYPFIDIAFADAAASFSLPSAVFDPPVTPQTAGEIDIRAKNVGAASWTPTNGYHVTVDVVNSAGQLFDFRMIKPGTTLDHLETGTFTLQVQPLIAGTYTAKIDLVGPNGLASSFGVPIATFSFKVLPASPPEILSYHPPNNAQVATLRPTLWAQYYDADNAPGVPNYWFELCNGGTVDAPTGCVNTNWITSSTWTVPAASLAWGKTAFWYVAVYDGANATYLEGPYALTPVIAQPAVTAHLAAASTDADVPGVNPQAGNYSASVVDAAVPVPGPPLEIRRTYNSQDYRGGGPDNNVALGRAATGSAACATTEGPEKAVTGSTSTNGAPRRPAPTSRLISARSAPSGRS